MRSSGIKTKSKTESDLFTRGEEGTVGQGVTKDERDQTETPHDFREGLAPTLETQTGQNTARTAAVMTTSRVNFISTLTLGVDRYIDSMFKQQKENVRIISQRCCTAT